MPKMKTHKGASKRFRVTGGGKLVRMKGHASHLRRKKPAKVRRQYPRTLSVHPSDRRRLEKVLPYIYKA